MLPERQLLDFIRKSNEKELRDCYALYLSLWKFYKDADFYLGSNVCMRDALEAHELMEQICGHL